MTDRIADARLIEAVARGGSEAFDEFYERFSRPVYALGLRWLQDPSDAEELVSDTLIRAWQQADRFDPTRGAVSAWLFGIARHVAADRWRVRGRHASEPLSEISEARHDMDTERLGDEFDLGLALNQLPAIHRDILILTYGQDQTATQIAERLSIPLGTVKSRRFHALRSMAALLHDRAPAGRYAEGSDT